MCAFPNLEKSVLFQWLRIGTYGVLADFEGFFAPQKGLVRKRDFREALILIMTKSLLIQINWFLTVLFWYPLFREIWAPFTKMEDPMRQSGLLAFEILPPTVRYESLFQHLPSLSIRPRERGRPAFSKDALLKAFVYKALRRLKTLRDLAFEMQNNPMIHQAVGFNPYLNPPSLERFSRFIRTTPHHGLQTVRNQLVQALVQEGVISANHLVMDSCPILGHVRENNLKAAVSNRFDKTRRPRGDRDARLGVMIHFPKPFKKQIRFFWGYRNHVVVDAHEELPIWEGTHPADRAESHQAVPMLQKISQTFCLAIETVGGDAVYDNEKTLCFIIRDMNAKPVITRNARQLQKTPYTLKGNEVFCQADLAMCRKGKMTVKRTGITYVQYCCPIHFGHQRQGHLVCPAGHPKFTGQKGCNALIRLSPSIREQIDYGSNAFKQIQKKRSSVKRVFSRLLCIAMQDPPVTGIQAIRNHCTIAHITVLLVALAAKRSGHPNKTRFVRSFVPSFLSENQKRFS
jgi:hypothetical protein